MERPILFSSEMVRAILDGRKTETRRVVRPQPNKIFQILQYKIIKESIGRFLDYSGRWKNIKCPYGKPGDVLYVRETFFFDENSGPHYRADCDEIKCGAYKWKPSIHMPKKFSRIKLEIKEIRVERIQEITMLSAINEGSLCVDTELVMPGYLERTRIVGLRDENPPIGPNAMERFKYLWDSLNKKRGFGWDKDPFVWVIKFKRL